MRQLTAAAFWAKIDRSGGPDACWPWTGCVGSHGYGSTSWPTDGKIQQRTAHTVAVQLARDEAPGDGRVLRHSCDNRRCCNPAHLQYGSAQDNSDDMVRRGRAQVGALNTNAALTEIQALEILNRAAAGEGIRALARTFNVSPATVSLIRSRKIWRHLEAA